MKKETSALARWGVGASILALTCMATAGPALAQDAAESSGEVVVVTGFRQSLEQALNVKRNATGAVDAIVAEDIADFPDLNLAESLQRIPGVAIDRDSGEGRGITVRGLSGQYTRVRINGMEAMAATGGEGGPNRGRGFDFNVFASELFNSIVVHKSASAGIDEGSLGAVVDLNTGRPFDYGPGVTLVGNAQAQFNDLNETWSPRVAGLFAYTSPDDTWGVSGSVAYSDSTTSELGHNTVRWQTATFNSVNGVDCGANPMDTGCTDVSGAFHPRIPRYGLIELKRERLGVTAGFQARPGPNSLVTVDLLYSQLDASRGEIWSEVLFRGNEGGMDVTSYTIDGTNITQMGVDNAWVRHENFEKAWTTDFYQFGARFDHDFSDTFRVSAFAGTAQSELDFPYEVTFMYDDRDATNYSFDYTDDENPSLIYGGADIGNPSNFALTEFRDRPTFAAHGFDTATFDVEWDLSPMFTVEAGISYKHFAFESSGFRRDRAVCGANASPSDLFDCDVDNNGVNELLGPPGTTALSIIYEYPDDVGAGTSTTWAIPSLSGWSEFFDLPSITPVLDQGATSEVEEDNLGAYVQLNGDVPMGSMDLRFDVGVRYVETDQLSRGYNSGTFVTVDREPYEDTLPSANVALWVTPDFVLRASAAEVMTRPGLGSLSPGGSVDSFNYRVSFQNPFLDPTRATTLDLGAEWYFAPEALISFAYFSKDIESFPINTTEQGTYASTGLPMNLLVATSPGANNPEGGPAESCNPANGGTGCWEIRSLGNGPGATVDGFEIGIQAPLTAIFGENLPPIIRGLGFTANYTYVDSEVDYTVGGTVYTERLLGLSNESWNATVYYEDDKLSARISAAYRDDYLSGTSGNSNIFEGYEGTFNVDFSSSYQVNESLELTFEGLNLTDDYQDRFVDVFERRRYEYDHTGSVFLIGARLRN
jgi:TonB-dependent receptor